jgi:hypothetical protein
VAAVLKIQAHPTQKLMQIECRWATTYLIDEETEAERLRVGPP